MKKNTKKTTKKTVTKKIVVRKKKVAAPAKTLVEKYRTHKSDTGSTEVQISLFSEKMLDLVKHLKKHPKDYDSRRGLLAMIGKRRRLLNYLKRSEPKKYEQMIADLGLRK